MQHLIKVIAEHWHLSAAQSLHLRMFSATSLVPLLVLLYLVLFARNKRKRT